MYPMMTSMGVDSVRGVPMEKSELAWKCALVLTLGRGRVGVAWAGRRMYRQWLSLVSAMATDT
jgi:hypothetical protein